MQNLPESSDGTPLKVTLVSTAARKPVWAFKRPYGDGSPGHGTRCVPPGYISLVNSNERARAIFLCEQTGLIPAHELPDFATELLVLGYDTPSLRELAGLPTGDRSDSADMWNAVRDELSVRHEDEAEAARFLLKYWAQETVEGRIDILAGSRLMNRVGWFPLRQPAELNELVYLLDLWDEMPQRREQTTAELLAFARNLMGNES